MVLTTVIIPVPRNKNLRQFFALLSGYFCQITVGLSLSWTSPALVKLQNENASIFITASEASTVASISAISGVISPIFYALMVDVYGRKLMMFIGILFHIANWILLYFSTHLYHLYIARILFGFALGYSYGLVPTYVGEVTETRTRGVFGVFTSVLLSIGVIYEYAVGPYVDFFILSLCNLVMPVLALICLVLMPESPYFLVRQKRYVEAQQVVMWLRNEESIENVEEEMRAIEEFVALSPKRPFLEVMKEFSVYVNKLAIILLTVLMLAQQFNASPVVKAYFHTIIEDTGTSLDVNISVLIVETCGLIIMIISFFMINRVGRKFLFFLTCTGCLIGTFITGLYFLLVDQEIIGNEASFMAIGGILCIQIFNGFGASTVPTLIASEMSTASIRSWLGAWKSIVLSAFNSASVKLFQVVKDGLGPEYGFWMYTIILAILMIILVFIMPETRGKSLQEIQEMLSKKGKKSIEKKRSIC